MSSIASFTSEKLERISGDEMRVLANCEPLGNNRVKYKGRNLLSFTSNDYLSLSQDLRVIQAATEALQRYGTGMSASRLISGNHPLYQQLEHQLARYCQTESALVFGSGFATNLGILSCLLSRQDLVIADRCIHASMIDGIRLSGAKFVRFPHLDLEACRRQLLKHRPSAKQAIIVIESVYSMQGDYAPIGAFNQLAQTHDCLLLVDHAHGLQGSQPYPADLKIGTLSKLVGGYGGYVATSKGMKHYLINRARTLIYSTALPPSVLAGASKALEILCATPKICDHPIQMASLFCRLLNIPHRGAQIVCMPFGSNTEVLQTAKKLMAHGYLVLAIRPPSAPMPLLRFTFNRQHTPAEVSALCHALRKITASEPPL